MFVAGEFMPSLDLKRTRLAAGSTVDYPVSMEFIELYVVFASSKEVVDQA